jgi:tetratricopeptide (TPR) repeat protein
VWSNFGALYYLQGKYDEAEKTLERAIALYEYGPALSNLATIEYRVRRDYTRAARILERAVKASPRDYRIWKNLAGAYRWAPGERERAADAERRAIAIIEEARRVEPDDPELIADLSDAFAFLGDTQQARQLIGRALTLAPANTPARRRRAEGGHGAVRVREQPGAGRTREGYSLRGAHERGGVSSQPEVT